jgi:hypothetical protein
MPIPAGGIVTAGQLARMQPKTYEAVGTNNLVGPVTDGDVPGCSVTLTTTTAQAVAVVVIAVDFDLTAATTTLGSGRLVVDGVGESKYAVFQQGPGTVSDRATCVQTYRVTLATAGTHTLKITATAPTGMLITGVYTSLAATVYEVV